jgi:hypothetical protein
MKLRFYIKDKKKIYTLKISKETKEAHYKYVNAPVFTRTGLKTTSPD